MSSGPPSSAKDDSFRSFRLQRSELAVPASSEKFFEKAARGNADSLFLDLEDAVAPSHRIEARASAVQALETIDWGTKTVSVRVNGLTTQWSLGDILAVARCKRLEIDRLLVPGMPGDFAATAERRDGNSFARLTSRPATAIVLQCDQHLQFR